MRLLIKATNSLTYESCMAHPYSRKSRNQCGFKGKVGSLFKETHQSKS